MASSSKPMGARGVSWRDSKTEALLSIWTEDKIQKALAASHKNIDVYEEISKAMHAMGHKRLAHECRIKTKGLRGDYRRCVSHNEKSGASPVYCVHYDVLDRILRNDKSARPPVMKRSWRVQYYKANKENMPIQGSDNISSADLLTINAADLRTHTIESPPGSSNVNPSNALQEQSQDFTAEHPAEESLWDDFEEEEGCSIQRGGPGDAVLSEQEGEEGDASGDQLPVSSAQQRKEESLQNEAQRQRRVAMLNNVAEKMMSQSRLDHEDTMERFDRLLAYEDRRFSLLEGQGERDRQALTKAFKEATRETVDVMRAAVDMLGNIAQIFREGRTQARVGEVPATATSPSAASPPSVTHRQLHLNCDCSDTQGALPSDIAYPVLAEDSMPESQSLLSPAPCSSGSVAASRRGKKRSCTGKQRVYFEP